MEFLIAFCVGGSICLLGQLLINLTNLTPARAMVLFVVAGVILGAVGLYGPFAEFAGCGATVPLTGFGWVLAEGVREAVYNKGFLGIFSGGLAAAATGTTFAVFLGFAFSLFVRSKDKA